MPTLRLRRDPMLIENPAFNEQQKADAKAAFGDSDWTVWQVRKKVPYMSARADQICRPCIVGGRL
jgi:hypothetical protein